MNSSREKLAAHVHEQAAPVFDRALPHNPDTICHAPSSRSPPTKHPPNLRLCLAGNKPVGGPISRSAQYRRLLKMVDVELPTKKPEPQVGRALLLVSFSLSISFDTFPYFDVLGAAARSVLGKPRWHLGRCPLSVEGKLAQSAARLLLPAPLAPAKPQYCECVADGWVPSCKNGERE